MRLGVLDNLPALVRIWARRVKWSLTPDAAAREPLPSKERLTRLMTSHAKHASKGVICLTQYQTPGSKFPNLS